MRPEIHWSRGSVAAVVASWSIVIAIIGTILLSAGGFTYTGDVDGTGGRTAAFILLGVAVIPAFVASIRLNVPRWLAVVAGALSLVLPTLLWFLVTSGRDTTAWSVYGGLQVLRGKEPFSDLSDVLVALADGGASGYANYASAVAWIEPLTLGLVPGVGRDALGLFLVALMATGIWGLARFSAPLTRLALLIVSAGSAWLLLLDRGNLDAALFLVPLAGVLLTRWRSTWVTWAVVAVLIWFVGAWKFYPFALGIMLLGAWRVRGGKLVIAGFLAASLGYAAWAWDEFQRSAQVYSTFTVLTDFPALGRLPITVRLIGDGTIVPSDTWATFILALLVVAGLGWGVLLGRRLAPAPWEVHLALPGSTVFLIVAMVGGFGFAYKVVPLLLVLPLLGAAFAQGGRFGIYSGLVVTALIVIPVVVSYGILLTSLASILAASVGLGAALAALGRLTYPQWRFFTTASAQNL